MARLNGATVEAVSKCRLCDKEFASPSALGGHMKGHNAGRKTKSAPPPRQGQAALHEAQDGDRRSDVLLPVLRA